MTATTAEPALLAAAGVARTAPRRSRSSAWTRRDRLLIALAGLLIGVLRAEQSTETDVLWGARFGMHFLATGDLYRQDVFSWTAPGREWIANSWGWNVILGAVYDAAGLVGLWVVVPALSIALSLLVAAAAARAGARPVPTAVVYVLLGITMMSPGSRATTVSTLMALAFVPLVRPVLLGTCRSSCRTAAALVGLQVVWMNLHSGALLGPVLALGTGAAVLLGTRRRGARLRRAPARLGALTVALGLACLATPYGLASVTHVAQVRAASVGITAEWDPPGLGSAVGVLGVIAVIVCAGLAVRAWRARRVESAAALVVVAAATLTAVRFVPMAAALAAPELAVLIGLLPRRTWLSGGFAVVVGLLAGSACVQFGHLGRLSDADASPTLIKQLPRGCTLVNDDFIGGAVELLRPDVRVSIDGRNDMYGAPIVRGARALLTGDASALEHIEAAGADCVLAPTRDGLVRRLTGDPSWRTVGHDTARTLLVRRAVQS